MEKAIKSFQKINSFGFGIAFSILFLRNKSCFYVVLVDESDLQRDKVANILHNFVWYIYIYKASNVKSLTTNTSTVK